MKEWPFKCNEFTTRELLKYMHAAFGTQISGCKFTANNIRSWVDLNKIPEAYGGHKISNKEWIESFGMYVLTVEGLDREVLTYLDELSKEAPKVLPKTQKQRKQRTELYYQILDKKKLQSTKKTRALSTLPDNYKEVGIKNNQTAKIGKRKIKC